MTKPTREEIIAGLDNSPASLSERGEYFLRLFLPSVNLLAEQKANRSELINAINLVSQQLSGINAKLASLKEASLYLASRIDSTATDTVTEMLEGV
jgi:uncharacterized membrane protein YiaA